MFKVGQRVVAKKTTHGIKRGSIYTIESSYKCCKQVVGIGIIWGNAPCCCGGCGKIYPKSNIYSANLFRPLDYEFVEKVIKQVKPEKIKQDV